jgi:hypothetical protein
MTDDATTPRPVPPPPTPTYDAGGTDMTDTDTDTDTTTDQYIPLEVCEDCAMLVANGETPPDNDAFDMLPRWEGWHIALTCPDDCGGFYAIHPCDGCGTRLHGTRHPATAFPIPDTTTTDPTTNPTPDDAPTPHDWFLLEIEGFNFLAGTNVVINLIARGVIRTDDMGRDIVSRSGMTALGFSWDQLTEEYDLIGGVSDYRDTDPTPTPDDANPTPDTNADDNSPTRVHPTDPWILMVRRVTGAGGKPSRPAAWIFTDGDTDDFLMGPDRTGKYRASFPTRLDAWHAAEHRAASERGYMGVVVEVVDGPLW